MKKKILITLALLMLSQSAFANTFSDNLTVYYDEIDVYTNSDYKPFIMNDRTLVPLRPIFETMGFEDEAITYDEKTQTASFGIDYIVSFTNESYTAVIINESGETDYYELDVPATIYDGRLYIPIRAFCEIWGTDINWDEETRSVYISSTVYEEISNDEISEDNEDYLDEDTQKDGENYEENFDSETPEDGDVDVEFFDEETPEDGETDEEFFDEETPEDGETDEEFFDEEITDDSETY